MSTLPDVKEAVNEYYKLKSKYETQMMEQKKKIINNVYLDKRGKKMEYKKLKPKCIHCKKSGGTLFTTVYVPETSKTDPYRELKASCGNMADPCNLQIVIRLATVTRMTETLDFYQKELKETSNEIIRDKNSLLFGILNSEQVLEKFESNREHIQILNSFYSDYLESYHKIVDNPEKHEELNASIANSYTVIQRIKDCIKRMNDTGQTQYAVDAVEIYVTELTPLLNHIQKLKYSENYVWFNEDTKTRNLIQEKYSIEDLSFYGSKDTVVAYDVSYYTGPNTSTASSAASSATSGSTETISGSTETISGSITDIIPQPIYGDGLDGVKWNVPEYDSVWSNMSRELKTALISDHEWTQEFVSNCVAARKESQPCTFITPRTLIVPPQTAPDGSADFGVNVYNQAFQMLSPEEQTNYLSLYSETEGGKNYSMLTNAMDNLVSKLVKFNGYL